MGMGSSPSHSEPSPSRSRPVPKPRLSKFRALRVAGSAAPEPPDPHFSVPLNGTRLESLPPAARGGQKGRIQLLNGGM